VSLHRDVGFGGAQSAPGYGFDLDVPAADAKALDVFDDACR
jgi:hypothetical protein